MTGGERPVCFALTQSRARVPGLRKQRDCARYFFLRAPDFLAARNEIPARMAFCWIAAAVRPSWRATSLVGVPALASCFKVRSSPAPQEEPSFEGRFAISHSPIAHEGAACGAYRQLPACRAPNMVY